MKKLINLICLLAISFVINSCGSTKFGSGNVLTEWRDVRNFNAISVSGANKLNIVQGEKYALKITADDNVIKSILAKVSDGRLIVEKNNSMQNTNIEVDIMVRELRDVEINGNCISNFPGTFRSHDLLITQNGSGKLECEHLISDGKIKYVSNGSNSSKINGRAETLLIKLAGSGSAFTEEFVADTIGVKITGSGNAFVKTYNYLNVNISGSGNCVYFGNPSKIDQSISGSGQLSKH